MIELYFLAIIKFLVPLLAMLAIGCKVAEKIEKYL